MPKRVLIASRDLFFRAKLKAVTEAAGAEVTAAEPCDVAVLELGRPGVAERIQSLVQQGTPVLAFGSHLNAQELRQARELGARAVPNSEIESALRALL